MARTASALVGELLVQAFHPGAAGNAISITVSESPQLAQVAGQEPLSVPGGIIPPEMGVMLVEGALLPPDVTLSGEPTGPHEIAIEIVSGGALGVATMRWSKDGGDSWQPEASTAATVEFGDTGITAEFSAGTYDEASRYSSQPDPDTEAEMLARMHAQWVERRARFDGILYGATVSDGNVTEEWPDLSTQFLPWASDWRINSLLVRGLSQGAGERPPSGTYQLQGGAD